MLQLILFIGGERGEMYNRVSEKVTELNLDVHPKIDLKNTFGLVKLEKTSKIEI